MAGGGTSHNISRVGGGPPRVANNWGDVVPKSFVKRLAPVVAAIALMGGAHVVINNSRSIDALNASLNSASRFLQLTDADAPTDDSLSASSGNRDRPYAINPTPVLQAQPSLSGNFMPNGWKLKPAGQQVATFNFPIGLTASPDGKTAIVSSGNGGMQGLTTINTVGLRSLPVPSGNLFMGVSVVGNKVYASGGNADRVFRYGLVGTALVPQDLTQAAGAPIHHGLDAATRNLKNVPNPLPAVDGIGVKGYPGNSVTDSRYLYVAGTLSEKSGTGTDACSHNETACSRITIIDTQTDKVVRRVPVGLDAYGLALDPVRQVLYVTNWADEAGRGNGVGTVSVIDIRNATTAREISVTPVGHHPTAVQLSDDRSRLFVTNTNEDTLSVLDVTTTPRVIATESMRAVDGVQVGAKPVALALAPDGKTLFVALAGMNAVEVRDGMTGARVAAQPVYIPTGWYPSALLVVGTPSHYRLFVANAKGAGTKSKSTGYNLSVGQELTPLDGTVSVIDLPAPTRIANEWTETVRENDRLDDITVDPCHPGAGVRVSQVLCPPAGQKSPVKHVLYIVTENKTFDQYFGDLDPKQYDADPTFTLYGKTFTPNHHAMAKRYSLSDRFFSDAQVSVTGHSWTSGAIATDHNELTWPADYDEGLRGTHGNGDPLKPGVEGKPGEEIGEAEDELDDPEGGYIFEAFKRAGAVDPAHAQPDKLSMAIYGESTARESGNMDNYKAADWKKGDIQYFDTCRAHMFISGQAPDTSWPDAPDQIADCGGRTLDPNFTLAHWTDIYKKTGRDVMPNFLYMSLPVNHTLGTNLGSAAPQSMVADNDYAIGLITEALSKSPFWASTVIMQTEDDTQAAGDHISPLRDYLQVSGPWAARGANHQWGSMPSLLRTIEQIFGVRPTGLYDRLALPQHNAFRASLNEKPDTAPYKAIKPLVPFAVNMIGAPFQKESMAMNWSTYDLIDEQLLNKILYAVARPNG